MLTFFFFVRTDNRLLSQHTWHNGPPYGSLNHDLA